MRATTTSAAGLALLTIVLAGACSRSAEPPAPAASGSAAATTPVPLADLPKIEAAAILEHTKALSDDSFEGRAPGTTGEEKTVEYLTAQFQKIGLKPGNTDGTYVQKVPLIGITGAEAKPLTLAGAGGRATFKWKQDVVAWTKRVADGASIDGSEMVFVGYGVTAPEYKWDDFKGLDVKGKTIVVLVNDPQVPDPADPAKLDARTFNGHAMTYYGRWTYKYEEAARRGAAGVFIVHEEGPAGYPYEVVQGFLGERFDLDHARQEHGAGEHRGLALARHREARAQDGGPGLRRAQEAGVVARLQAGAAPPQGVDGAEEHQPHDRLAQRRRQA